MSQYNLDIKTRQGCFKKEKSQANLSCEHGCKYPTCNTNKLNPMPYVKIDDPVQFNPVTQGWFSSRKPINIIHHINRTSKKTTYKHLKRCRKTCDKTQDPFVIKNTTLRELGIGGNSIM